MSEREMTMDGGARYQDYVSGVSLQRTAQTLTVDMCYPRVDGHINEVEGTA